jgi:hypothetical protein
MSRNARRAMRAKIHRLTSAQTGKVDASDYGPEQVLDSEAKTGMRPVSRRAYKKGGKVVAVAGADAKQNAGKKPRAGKKHLTVDALVNRNLKDANEAREGKKHVGALKTGGRATKKAYGGSMDEDISTRPTDRYGNRATDKDLGMVRTSGGMPDRDISSRPTDSSGRRITNKELGMDYSAEALPMPKPKPVMRGKPMSVSEAMAGMRSGRKHGGEAWEGSAKDESQDKKLAKKYGMSMAAWEKSKMDKKHDTQHSSKGLNKGGRTGKSLGGVLKDVGKYAALGVAGNEILKNPSLLMGGLGALAYSQFGKKKGAPGATANASPTPAVAGKKSGGGLYANINAKQERIANGSKERMRKVGSKGAPTAEAFKQSARTAKAYGGFTSLDGEFQTQQKVTGRHAKMHGGSLSGLEMNSGGRAKKKKSGTNINIVIATGKGQPQMDPDMQQAPSPQGVPVQMPPPPQAGAPMPMPMPMPIPMPQAGGPGAGPAPMPRKAGGRTYRSYKDMDAGAGSGLGRLEKTEIQKRKK